MRDLRWEISERGTIELLIKETERMTSRQKQERLLAEENERIRAIATELERAIVHKKTSNEMEEEHLMSKLTSTRVHVNATLYKIPYITLKNARIDIRESSYNTHYNTHVIAVVRCIHVHVILYMWKHV